MTTVGGVRARKLRAPQGWVSWTNISQANRALVPYAMARRCFDGQSIGVIVPAWVAKLAKALGRISGGSGDLADAEAYVFSAAVEWVFAPVSVDAPPGVPDARISAARARCDALCTVVHVPTGENRFFAHKGAAMEALISFVAALDKGQPGGVSPALRTRRPP